MSMGAPGSQAVGPEVSPPGQRDWVLHWAWNCLFSYNTEEGMSCVCPRRHGEGDNGSDHPLFEVCVRSCYSGRCELVGGGGAQGL